VIDLETRVACPHADACGGCPAIEQSYREQLAGKRRRVDEALARHSVLEPLHVDDVAGADPIHGYRVRAKLVVGPGGELGLYAKGGEHEVVDVPECRVLAPELADVVACLRGWLSSAPAALRALDVRVVADAGDEGALVTLIVDADREPDEMERAALAASVRACSEHIAGLALSVQSGPQLLGRGLRVVAGAERLRDRHAPASPWVYALPGAFVQAHRGQTARVHERVRAALGSVRGQNVLELFSGSGALGLSLAAAGARMTLVDAWAPALEGALQAARAQGIEGIDALAGDAAEVATKLAAAGRRFDMVIVNPPRRGLAPALRRALAGLAPALVVYVSCNPETFARDLARLRWLGFAAQRVEPFDLIPLSDEVECLAFLRPARAPEPQVLYSDGADVWIVAKEPHEPTTPQGDEHDSLLRRVQRLSGVAELAPVHRLDAGTSGACIFARRPDVAAWSRALATGTKEYVAGTRGVTRAKGSIARELVEGGRRLAAHTRYRRIEVVGGHSLLRVRPEEGRTHQIRRHLAGLNHALLGDARYGHAPTNRHLLERHGLDRPFLHCARIELTHPRSGARLEVEAPLAGDLASVLASLRARADDASARD
jgi:23S rRNA (uracil1939-C5)-methyltransferase